jgi:WD40 repeat protein
LNEKGQQMKFDDAFISYGRADSKAFAINLNEKLTAAGLNVWFDQNDILPAEDFQKKINDGIEKAHNFLFIISPHSVNSPYCLKEIKEALKNNKRIIPLLHVEQISKETWQQRNPHKTEDDWKRYQEEGLHSTYNNKNMHPTISKINAIRFADNLDNFDTYFQDLLSAISKHQDYVEQHTNFLVQALEWQNNQQQTNYFLVGEERGKAEKWLKQRFIEEQPPCIPTDLHCEFICESIKNSHNLLTQVFLAAVDTDEAIKEKIRKTLMRESFTVWTNKTDIKTGTAFPEAINQGIEGADNFVYLISLDSLNSEYCQWELNQALANNKRIIPLLVAETDLELIPLQLKKLQFLDFTQSENAEEYRFSADKLLQELKKEPSYYEKHKILLVKARKWQKQNQNSSLLLRGYNLQHFEAWLKVAKQREDYPPLPLQEEFITASLNQSEASSLEVFISYSRTDSDLARKINDALQELGKTTWFDQESIATGTDFQQEINRGIASSDNFLFIISPKSVNSPYCAGEVEYAKNLGKRFITALHRPLSDDDKQKLPAALANVQWLDFNQHGGEFFANFNELVRTLDTDRDHVRSHTKWSQRALEWDEKGKNVDLLLRGSEFAVAEAWLKTAETENKKPAATELQKELIDKSREAIEAREKQDKRQILILRSSLIAAVVLLLGSIGASIFAVSQLKQAKYNEAESLGRYSQSLMNEHKELEAFVTAIKAGKIVKSQNTTNPEVFKALDKVLVEGRERNRLEGHQSEVNSVSFSPDGKTIATAGDKPGRLWNLKGELLQEFKGHQGYVLSVSFSPDGKTIATASSDNTARLWNLQGQLLQEFKGHQDRVWSVDFNPDGKTIATASSDNTARLWNLQGQLLQEFKGHQSGVLSVSFSPDGKTIATASYDKTARLWNLKGELLQEFNGHQGYVSSVSFSPDGKTIATASSDKTARLWNLKGELLQEFNGHQSGVNSVSFSPDGKTIATASYDTTARLWNLQGQLLQEFKGHQGYVLSVSFSPDGKTIATSSSDKTARLWNLKGELLPEFKGHQGEVNSVNFSPDGKTIATASSDNTARLWNLKGELLQEFKGHQSWVSSVSFSPDGKTIATASYDKTARLWNLKGELLQEFKGHQNHVNSVSFSPDGKTIATASYDKTARLWNLKGELLQEFNGHQSGVNSVSFSPDGKTIATASSDKTARLWNLKGELLQEFKGHQNHVNSVSFSPDGKTIATASYDKTARLWNLKGELLQEFKGHQGGVSSVSFSPDGKTIATASYDKTARLWNLKGELLQEFKGHQGWVSSVSFSPDGKTIATASYDKTARLWNLKSLEQLLDNSCDWVRDYLENNPNVSKSDKDLCDRIGTQK